MAVAAYIRVSTDEQADKGNSLSEQKERLAAYCVAMGWNAPTYYVDEGYSAKNLKRPAVKRLLEDVQQGKINTVLTTKIDRLCRNLLDLLQTVENFNTHECSYVSASESFDTSTAVGLMTLQLLGTFAEFERGRISERVKDNMLSLARNTSKVLTRPCFGYDIVDGLYHINEEEAEHVRYMFDLAENNHGHRMIAKMLNDRQVRTKSGALWDQINVKRLMINETLIGRLVYNKRKTVNGKTVLRDQSEWIIKEDNHSPIIDPERFATAHEIIRSRRRAHKHADSESYLLTGLVTCQHCGKNMKGNTSRNKTKYGEYTYYRYICSSYVLGYGCKHHAVHRDDLEKAIIDEIKRVASSSTRALELKIAVASAIDEIKNLKEQISRVDRRMQKQIDAFSNDLISEEDLKTASERVSEERNSLRLQIEKLETRSGDQTTVQDNAKRLINTISGPDRVKAKAALRVLIENIEIADGKNIGVTWRI